MNELLAFQASQPFTLGVELELQLVDRRDGDLTHAAADLLRIARKRHPQLDIKLEITESMIEIATGVRLDYQGILGDLCELRDAVCEAAELLNVGVCGGGTHPFQSWTERHIADGPRMRYLSDLYGYLAKQFTVFGQHVHIGCPDGDAAIALATDGLALARENGLPTAVTLNLTALAGALADRHPERAKALLRESTELRATLDYEAWVELARAVVVSARLGDWPQVLDLAPPSIRHLHWVGNRVLLCTILNLVARALLPNAAEAAAVVKGAAERLAAASIAAVDSSAHVPGSPGPPPRQAGGPHTTTGFLTELNQSTTQALHDTLGEARLGTLRAEGEAMGYDRAVAYALDAIAQVTPSSGAATRRSVEGRNRVAGH